MTDYGYDRFIKNFMPLETNGRILISANTPDPKLRSLVMDSPPEHIWCVTANHLCTAWVADTTHFAVTMLSHRGSRLIVNLR